MVSNAAKEIDMSVLAIGAADYEKAIEGLSLSQAKLLLTMRGFDAEQQKSLLLKEGLIATSDKMSAKLVKEALSNSSLNAAEQERILVLLKLADADTNELLISKSCTEERLRAQLATTSLDATEKEAIITKITGTASNEAYAISFETLTASIWANIKAFAVWLVTNPIGQIALAGAIIFGLVKGINALTVTIEEQREKLENTKEDYSKIASEIKSINDELTTTNQRMQELEGKDSLSFTEKEEYENLVKINNQLQRKIDLLSLEEEEKRKKQNQAFVDTMNKDIETPRAYTVDPTETDKAEYVVEGVYATSGKEYVKVQFQRRKKLFDELANAETKDEQDRIQKRIDEIDEFLRKKKSEWETDSNGIDYIQTPSTDYEKKVNEYLDFINDFQDKRAIATGGNNAKTNSFKRITDNWQFDDAVQGLQDLGEQGKVTADMLEDPQYDTFIEKLYEIGIIDSVNNLEDIALAFNELGDGADTAEEGVSKAISSLETFSKKLDGIQSAYQSVLSAIKEYNEEGYLSVDTYQALMGIEPEYLKYIMDEEGQLRLGTDAMNDYTAALIDNMAKKQMMAIVDYVTGLDEEARQLYLNREAAEDASEGLAAFANSLIYAKVAAGELTQEDANKVLKMLDGVIAWAEKTKDGIGEGGLGGQSAKDLSDRIDDIKRQLRELADSEALEKLKYRFDIIEQSITNITNSISLLDNTLNSQAEDDYIGRLETVTEQLSLAQQKSVLLRNEFNELNNTTYNSANEANELATRMKSVADSIADNSKNIMDYGKNMVEYYMSAMSMIGNLSDNTIERATSLFERNVKTLQEGGLAGLQFNLSPTVPQSAYERQRDENRKLEDEMRDYYDTVAKMQKTALDMQYQETVEDNNRKRQELNDSLNEALLEQRGYSDKSINLQRRTNEITSAEQKRDNAEKLAEAKSFSAAILDVANNLSESIKKITIDPPHFSTGWNDLKDEFKRRMNEAWESAGSSQGAIDVPYYNQGDYANNRYGNGTIATSGCGPTAMAMVLSSFDKDVDPVTAANYSMSHGFYANGQGTSWDYFDSIAKEYGIKSQVIGTTARSIKKALSNGDKLIVSMAPGHFTKNGHFIVLSGITDDGKVFVSDPGSRERSNQTWDVKLIADEARQAWAFSAYAAGTSGAVGGTSLVGEKGKELGILPNGKVIELGKHGAELVDIPKGTQIFNHEQTEEIEKYTGNLDGKSIPKYATGTLSGYSDLGNLDVVTQLPKLSVEQIRKLIEKYFSRPNSVVKLSDAEGIYKAQMDSGISALATLAIGALESTYGTSPIAQEKGNLWGYGAVDSNPMGGAHKYSATVGEAAQKYSAELYKDFYEGWNEKTIYEMGNKYASDKQWKNKVTNIMGNFTKSLTSSGLDEITASATQPATSETYLEDIASNTKAIRQDFETRLEGWLNGNIDTETSNTIEDDLLKYISDKIDKSAYNNEEFIEKWDKFQAINTESQKVFKDLDKSLLESVGTSSYNAVKDEVLKTVSDYTNTMMKTSSDATLAELKNQYNLNKSVADMMLAFYNQKKAEGATAGELSVIIEKYNEQLDKVNDISDKWISTLQSQTEYLKTQDNLILQASDNTLSWLEKGNERLLKQYENTDENDIAARKVLEQQITDGYNQIIAENQNKKNTAHQNVLDLYNDERYLPIFQRYDVEEWFDASGEATARYNEELAALSATDSELAGIMQQLFSRIQQNKQAWYTADEAVRNTNDSLKDFEKTQKLNKVTAWEKYQNRLIEVINYQKSLNDSITEAKQSMYDFYDSLREEANSITSELQANMHLGEWLSEDTRNQLFNLQDYTAEMNKINDLRIRMESLYTKYQSDINGLKEEESWQAEKITAEYNKQVAALQDELSIAKQSLQVAKDQAAIENAMKERDTQIIMGNRVQNVADPDKLYELEQAAQQSKLELQNLGTKSKEAADIRNMERVSDNYSFDMSAIQNNLGMLGDMTDKEKELFSDFLEPTETITAKLNSIAKQDPWYMIANDKSTDIYINIDKDRIRGYNLAYDYETEAEMMAKFMGAAGFDDYETNKVIEYLQKNHDNKTITDSHNLGYPKHYPNEDALKERYPLPIYNEETITDILTSAGVEISKEVVSDVLQTISATVLDNGIVLTGDADYETNKLPNGITLTGDADYSMAEPKYRYVSLEDKFPGVDFSSLITTPLYSVIDSIANSKILANDKAMSVINNMGDNVTDNSIHIDNVNITKPIKTADEIVSSLVQKASTLAKTTNNQR